ncbi:MAG: hypothetical protein WAT39_17495 [Planctomycetota bacterium]
MLKTALIAIACSAATASAMFVYVGRSEYSTNFQADVPYGAAFKVTPDPANVWSWHHTFTNVGVGTPQVADVLVDMNGDLIMDTVHDIVRVMITDVQVFNSGNNAGVAWIVDSGGKRLACGIGQYTGSGPVQHISLTTPIVLPVGSFLHVEMLGLNGGGAYEVNLIGRIVNP